MTTASPTWSESARVIDVAHWQIPHDLDWTTAETAGVVGVIAKATQGLGYEDPAFFEHSVDAYKDKMPLLGAYHFGDGSDGRQQAQRFLDRLHRAFPEGLDGLMAMLDVERNGSQMEIAGAEDFVLAIHEALGRWPWLYMGRDGPTGDGEGLPSPLLSNCPLLLPKYGPAPTKASLPQGFKMPTEASERAGTLRLWQFTDGAVHGGAFPGLGKVDQSRFVGLSSLEEAKKVWA